MKPCDPLPTYPIDFPKIAANEDLAIGLNYDAPNAWFKFADAEWGEAVNTLGNPVSRIEGTVRIGYEP